MRRLKQFLLLSCIALVVACTKPTLYREDNIKISKTNIERVCATVKAEFFNYSCVEYFNKTYKVEDSVELLKIQLNKQKLHLIYQSKSDENGDLFKQYERLIDSLRPETDEFKFFEW